MIEQIDVLCIGDVLSGEFCDQYTSIKIENSLYGSWERGHIFNILLHYTLMKLQKTSIALEIETSIRK